MRIMTLIYIRIPTSDSDRRNTSYSIFSGDDKYCFSLMGVLVLVISYKPLHFDKCRMRSVSGSVSVVKSATQLPWRRVANDKAFL